MSDRPHDDVAHPRPTWPCIQCGTITNLAPAIAGRPRCVRCVLAAETDAASAPTVTPAGPAVDRIASALERIATALERFTGGKPS